MYGVIGINFVDRFLNQGAPAEHKSAETPIGHESLRSEKFSLSFPTAASYILFFFHRLFLSFLFRFLNLFSIPHSTPLSSRGNGRNSSPPSSYPNFLFDLFFFNHLCLEHGFTPCLYTCCISFFPLAKTGYGDFSFIKNDALSPD